MSVLRGKVVIVTGASKGIGAGIARAFASAGASVVVNYATSREDAERVVREIAAVDGKAIAVQADVSVADEVRRLFAEAKRAFGPVDVLINNAGVFKFDPLEEVTEAEFHREFNTNVLGTILAVQEAVKQFGPEGGSIINIGSLVSSKVVAGSLVYSATKHALDGVTRVLAAELGPRNIRVNSINPGPVDTEGARRTGVIDGDWGKQLIAETPLGRFGQPDDIARLALVLASPDAGWVTGQTLVASGGLR
jgi:3-oxoacyl-[acyl-carrier protein] reductase